MNLVPNIIPKTDNYWCTWETQCNLREEDAPNNDRLKNRDYINEEILFGEQGILHGFEGIREDVIAVLDAGWDIPVNDRGREQLGSLIPEESRFPSLQGTPAEKLRTLVQRVEALGFRGLGLWVPVHTPYTDKPRPVEQAIKEDRPYWEERARWCHEAGIVYWKVDLGAYCGNSEYRAMMAEAVRKYAPGICVEQAVVGQWLFHPDTEHIPTDPDVIESRMMDYTRRVLPLGDELRLYDVAYEVKYSCTIHRVARTLRVAREIEGECAVINVEDADIIGAALGCSIGAMRHERERQHPPRLMFCRPIIETKRALRWHRIAPPYAANAVPSEISETILTDSWYYPPQPLDEWPWVSDATKCQIAPAAIARNMPLPEVDAQGELPFVLSAVHPQNGALSVAAVPRTTVGRMYHTPPAKISVQGRDIHAPIGLFGRWQSVTVTFPESVEGLHLWAQDLAENSAKDITQQVTLSGNTLTIPFKALDTVISNEDRDVALPGFVLQLLP